ncbi:MAG: hypothetical protein WKG00_41960 [Polyangiaceae bacterium]
MRPIAHATLAILASLVLAAMLAIVTDARAGASYTSPYTYEQTYGTALRLLRVDLDLKITEKDADLGYVLFEYHSPESGKRISNGSLEVVRARDTVHVSVQLPQMPSYHEQMIVDALARKLMTEHGEPPRKKRDPQPTPPPPDGGAPDADAGAGAGTG